jgi:hypothetical protein
MEELFEKDDLLKKLIKEEGMLCTSPDFTLQVMQLVEKSRKEARFNYKPLLSRKAWIIIATGVTILLVSYWCIIPGNNQGELVNFETIKPAIDFLKKIDLSIPFSSGALMLTTITLACMGALLMLDIILSQKYRRTSA